jgi:hypothetical protein
MTPRRRLLPPGPTQHPLLREGDDAATPPSPDGEDERDDALLRGMDDTGVLHLDVVARLLACRCATPPPRRTTDATHRPHSTEQRAGSIPLHAASASGATASPGKGVLRPPVAVKMCGRLRRRISRHARKCRGRGGNGVGFGCRVLILVWPNRFLAVLFDQMVRIAAGMQTGPSSLIRLNLKVGFSLCYVLPSVLLGCWSFFFCFISMHLTVLCCLFFMFQFCALFLYTESNCLMNDYLAWYCSERNWTNGIFCLELLHVICWQSFF